MYLQWRVEGKAVTEMGGLRGGDLVGVGGEWRMRARDGG